MEREGPHEYDELLQVRCCVRNVASWRVEFGYAIERQQDGEFLATARTALSAVDSNHAITLLAPAPDPIRL